MEKIGEGGMGVVWRSMDTTLDRETAIKILPEAFASDRERLLRFEREAKVLASLNHANIASIFGLHEAGGVRFLAMEYVPGENLAELLSHGPIPMEQALEIGRQIAEALEAAHELGVVHRDLKPSNVVVTPGGQVKVLDFGLAKAMLPDAASGASLALSPTVTSPATMLGTILGTAAYMSPEQARGGAVDKRADIWALGCVLLEMLTGRRTFAGSTVTDTLAAVLRADIELDSLPRETPRAVRHLLERCLDRDPRTRLRDAGEARIVLSHPAEADTAVADGAPAGPRRFPWIALAVATLLLGVGVGRALIFSKPTELPALSFRIAVDDRRLRTGSIALSPDGRNLVMQVQRPGGNTELWLRPLGENEARALPGTTGGTHPFWSPDSREVAFFAHGQLLRLPLDGTSPRVICAAHEPLGGTWNADGVILLGQVGQGLHRVDASGGEPVQITTVRDDEEEHSWPTFLPDGDHFLFLADANTTEAHRVCLSQLSKNEVTVLRTGIRSSVAYDPKVGVLFGERRQLVAYPLDLGHRQLGSSSVLVSDVLMPLGSNHEAPFTLSRNGIMAIQHGTGGYHLVKVDHEGTVLNQYGDIERFANPSVSRDGRRALFELLDSTDETLVWMLDLERGVRTPISQRNARSDSGAWSADGKTIYFDSDFDSTQVWVVYKRAADGGGQPEQVGRPEEAREAAVLQCSLDGRWLLVYCIMNDANTDLYLGRLDAQGMVSEWINWSNTPQAKENFGALSPDGKYIVYASDASGLPEIYLAPLEGGPTTNRWQVSTEGGVEPRFSPDGRSIYYRELKDRFMTASVRFTAGGEVTLGAPVAGFEAREPDISYYRNSFDVFPDGSILILRPADDDGAAIDVRTAWWPAER